MRKKMGNVGKRLCGCLLAAALICASLPGMPAVSAPAPDIVLETGPAVSVQDALDSLGSGVGAVQVKVYSDTLGSGAEISVPTNKGITGLALIGQGGTPSAAAATLTDSDIYANGVPLEIEAINLGRVFGGSLDQDTNSGTSVTVMGPGTVCGVYGGGRVSLTGLVNGDSATVTGDTFVQVTDVTLNESSAIAGGGLLASVDGNTEVIAERCQKTGSFAGALVMGGCALDNDLSGAGDPRPGYVDTTGYEPNLYVGGNTSVKVNDCTLDGIAGNTAVARKSESSKQDGYLGTAEVRGATDVFVGDGTVFSGAIVGNAYLPLDGALSTTGSTPLAPRVYDLQNARAFVRGGSVVNVGTDSGRAVEGTGTTNDTKLSKILGGSYTCNGQTGTDGDIQLTVENTKNLQSIFGGSWSGCGTYSKNEYAGLNGNSYEVTDSQDMIQGDIKVSVSNVADVQFFTASSAINWRTVGIPAIRGYDLQKYDGTNFVPVEDFAKVVGDTEATLDGVSFSANGKYSCFIAGAATNAGRGSGYDATTQLDIQGDLKITVQRCDSTWGTMGAIVGGLCGKGTQTGDVVLVLDSVVGGGDINKEGVTLSQCVWEVYGTYVSNVYSSSDPTLGTAANPVQKTDGNLEIEIRNTNVAYCQGMKAGVLTGDISVVIDEGSELFDLQSGGESDRLNGGAALIGGNVSTQLLGGCRVRRVTGGSESAGSSDPQFKAVIDGDLIVDVVDAEIDYLACYTYNLTDSTPHILGDVTATISAPSVVKNVAGNAYNQPAPGKKSRIVFDNVAYTVGNFSYWNEVELWQKLEITGRLMPVRGTAVTLRGVWNPGDVVIDYNNAFYTGTPYPYYFTQGWTGAPDLLFQTYGSAPAAQWYLNGPVYNVLVTFDPNGGDWAGDTVPKTMNAPLTLADVPTDPTRSGYLFSGWYSDLSDPSTKLDASNIPAFNTDVTYYAKWDTQRTVTFRVAYGTWADGTRADKTVTVVGNTLSASDVPTGMIPDPGCSATGSWNIPVDTTPGGLTGDITYIYSFIPIPSRAKVTFEIVGGIWWDGTSAKQQVYVPTLAGAGTLAAADVPTGMRPNAGYTGGAWDVTPDTTVGGITGDITYTYRYTPVTSAATVRFKIVNGTWSDGTDGDILLTVPLLGGAGTLSAADVPAGMQPNSDCAGGAWNVVPNTSPGGITANTTYIYSFVPLVSSAEVTFRVERGTWADGTETDKTVTVSLALGLGTLQEADVPTGMVPHFGYGDGAWVVQPNTDVDGITGDVTYIYRFSPLPQVTVTFKVEHGTWADGSRSDKVVPVAIHDGAGTLLEANVPTGMLPESGYAGGAWDTVPNTAENAIVADTVYTYSFVPSVTPPPVDQYVLTYETNGGRAIEPESYPAGSVVKLTKVPIRASYTFAGWYLDASFQTQASEITMTGDTTVYAKWERGVIPDDLNGAEHNAYARGYPDGTIKPTANITRAEVAVIFYRLLEDDVRASVKGKTGGFPDVKKDSWYAEEVAVLAELEILVGYEDGTFRGDRLVTRAEFATIAARFSDGSYSGEDLFTDISKHWGNQDINKAAASGWITGYNDGTFGPNRNITRAETMTLINNVLLRRPESKEDLLSTMKTWRDNMDTSKWYYLAVQEATNDHEFTRKDDGIYESWTVMA